MSKVKVIGISVLVLLGVGLIVNFIPDSLFDDTESRTYKGTIYEYGYYYEGHAGLRSRSYEGFLLSSDDGVVFKFGYNTVRHYSAYGTFTGIIGESIVITIGTNSTTYNFDSSDMIDEKYRYENCSISTVISNIRT